MINILVATDVRGFLNNLFNNTSDQFNFDISQTNTYEKINRRKIFMNKVAKSTFMDQLGYVRTIEITGNDHYNLNFSYNKFLNTKTNYIIYLENPYALTNYSTKRNKTFLGNKKISKLMDDPKLKGFICISQACQQNLEAVYNIPERVFVEQIYPYLPNQNINLESIVEKSNKENINCLYISSKFILKGGGDILHAFERFKDKNINNIKLKIVTPIVELEQKYVKIINNNNNIELIDYNLAKEELDVIYRKTNILLNTSRMESFGLVILEAMKHGVSILSTDLYAIPEMVTNDVNGYLVEPKYRFFNKNNIANDKIWYNREKTIYDDFNDINVINFLFEKINYLNLNRDILAKLSINSYIKSKNENFNSNNILSKWENLFDYAKEEKK